jgi:hypothetical protein
MGNVEEIEITKWVDGQMTLLAPPTEWQPNAEDGLKRFRSRIVRFPVARGQRIFRLRIIAVTLILLAVLPAGFVVGQRFVERHLFPNVEVLRLNLEERVDVAAKALSFTYVVPPPPPRSVSLGYPPGSAWDDLSRDVGFWPKPPGFFTLRELFSVFRLDPLLALEHARWMPQIGKLGLRRPNIAVRGPSIGEIRLDVPALQAALRAGGHDDVTIPSAWHGAVIRIEFSPVILWQYARKNNDVLRIEQSKPPRVIAPSGFSMPDFADVVLRIFGVDSTQADYLRSRLIEDPSVLLCFPASAIEVYPVPFGAESVRSQSASGIVIRNVGDNGKDCVMCPSPSELVMLWGVGPASVASAHRFAVKSRLTDDQAAAIAHAF